MLKKVITLFAPIALASMVAFSSVQASPTPDASGMFLEDVSPVKGQAAFVNAIKLFKEEVTAAGWSLLGTDNVAGVLSERGFTVHPVMVFSVCSGKYSSKLLAKDETRFIASMIPCRVAIYMKSDGTVVISRMNSVGMAQMIGGEAGSVIQQSGTDMEGIIAKTMSRLSTN
ncbi:DUF302 domain-containing protein [Thiothrix subterranea]|uniref:DUF302 domain-containing protein n=1 Tax=Thiothrix subterranea TaxID=2735563 RepID=UPI00192CE1CA|nr:DUF302 domain-containing protein [Thiothrix subterranea]QQZ29471.1 DUF302 domain-containing protein [Thiothrix subterranea]